MNRSLCRLAFGVMLAVALSGGASLARAETVSVAVAANFADAARALGVAFKAATGNELTISAGSTGGLYAQIAQAAPFEVFLAADSKTPGKTIAAGLAVKGSLMTYAVGRIVLYSANSGLVTGSTTLQTASFDKLAIANPKTAPYGAAAVAALHSLGLYAQVADRLVVGENIAQTYQFVDSGNAQLGFVALSQVVNHQTGSQWLVPQADYPPITQDAVLLMPGRDSAAAKAFLSFLRTPEAVKVIESFGYAVPDQ